MEKDETNKDDNDGKDCENKQMKKIHDILTPAVPEQKILVSAVITISLLPSPGNGHISRIIIPARGDTFRVC